MLSPQFYTQLTVCSFCHGFGTEKTPPVKNSPPCKECGGLGVYMVQTDRTFIWGLPTFIDFGKRKRIRTLKILMLTGAVVFLIIVYIALTQITVTVPQ